MAKKAKVVKKKKYKNIPSGVVTVNSSFNNTIVTFAEENGNVVCWKSSGAKGFKGTKKGTPFAAQMAAESAAEEAKKHGMKSVGVKVSGIGSGREAAIRSIEAVGLTVTSIEDTTPLPFNGCRPKKRRRP